MERLRESWQALEQVRGQKHGWSRELVTSVQFAAG